MPPGTEGGQDRAEGRPDLGTSSVRFHTRHGVTIRSVFQKRGVGGAETTQAQPVAALQLGNEILSHKDDAVYRVNLADSKKAPFLQLPRGEMCLS